MLSISTGYIPVYISLPHDTVWHNEKHNDVQTTGACIFDRAAYNARDKLGGSTTGDGQGGGGSAADPGGMSYAHAGGMPEMTHPTVEQATHTHDPEVPSAFEDAFLEWEMAHAEWDGSE